MNVEIERVCNLSPAISETFTNKVKRTVTVKLNC